MCEDAHHDTVRTYYSVLLSDALNAWTDAGHETEAFAPTLLSARLDELEFSKTKLLRGKIDNLQPMLEFIGVLGNGEQPPVTDEAPITTLDKACGAIEVPHVDVLFARALAFTSELSGHEANAIAISLFCQEILGMKFGVPIILSVRSDDASQIPKNYRKVHKALNKLMDDDAADFFVELADQRIDEISFCCYKGIVRFDLFAECNSFWKGYYIWRQDHVGKNNIQNLWKKLKKNRRK